MGVVPQADFEFSTGDSEFYGYVKVVDDINKFDMNGIKSEVGSFKTMIYPDNYFAGQGGGTSCCTPQ
jgi:hypothetical protein